MSELELAVRGWIASDYGDEAVRATTGSLHIAAGEGLRVPVTEIEDRLGQTVRCHVNVPLVTLAEWLLTSWWRLRWEGRPQQPTIAWRQAHCLAGIGGDVPWPPLELFSDGELIHLEMEAEDAPDAAAIRYLRQVFVDVPAADFEGAVDRFLDVVEARLGALLPAYRDIAELREELAEERSRPSLARQCRWQALAGIDPGEAPEAWLQQAQALSEMAGATTGDEIMGVLPQLDGGIRSAAPLLDAMKRSATTVDLSWLSPPDSPEPAQPRERPWQRGARLAQQLRAARGLGAGPLASATLAELLSTPVPLQGQLVREAALGGGLRHSAGNKNGRTHILITSGREESQRFFLARMIGAAHVLAAEEHLIPVTRSDSALQKLERSFAQELLCPWVALDAFTDDRGLHDEALAEAAEHFQVSDWLVRTTLVNRGKLSRRHLPHQLG